VNMSVSDAWRCVANSVRYGTTSHNSQEADRVYYEMAVAIQEALQRHGVVTAETYALGDSGNVLRHAHLLTRLNYIADS